MKGTSTWKVPPGPDEDHANEPDGIRHAGIREASTRRLDGAIKPEAYTAESRKAWDQMSSRPEKKKPISKAAVSGASEPWGQLLPMLVPRSWRMVPVEAFFGSVAPMVSRHFRMAPSASRTRAKILPELMKSGSSPKKGRSLWPA